MHDPRTLVTWVNTHARGKEVRERRICTRLKDAHAHTRTHSSSVHPPVALLSRCVFAEARERRRASSWQATPCPVSRAAARPFRFADASSLSPSVSSFLKTLRVCALPAMRWRSYVRLRVEWRSGAHRRTGGRWGQLNRREVRATARPAQSQGAARVLGGRRGGGGMEGRRRQEAQTRRLGGPQQQHTPASANPPTHAGCDNATRGRARLPRAVLREMPAWCEEGGGAQRKRRVTPPRTAPPSRRVFTAPHTHTRAHRHGAPAAVAFLLRPGRGALTCKLDTCCVSWRGVGRGPVGVEVRMERSRVVCTGIVCECE